MVVTTLGWLLGSLLLTGIGPLAAGFGTGILQWVVLQQRISKAWRWIVASTLGWAVGWIFVLTTIPNVLNFLDGLVAGFAIGIAQWWVLKDEVEWSGWWVVISVVGWTTGMTLLPGVLLTGTMAGAITGFALELLLRFPKPVEENEP